MKRSLLAITIAAATMQMAQAAPFMPMDARGLAMGNTGVASAKRAHAPAYNPSLLSQANANDDFSIIFPQIGAVVTDENVIIDEAKDINDDIYPKFENLVSGKNNGNNNNLEKNIQDLFDSIKGFENIGLNIDKTETDPLIVKQDLLDKLKELRDGNKEINSKAQKLYLNLDDLDTTVGELSKSLNAIDANPISARLGVSTAVAVPSKKFAVAVSISGTANFSARIDFSDNDLQLLNAYPKAAKDYVNKAIGVTNNVDGTLEELETSINAIDSNTDNQDLLEIFNDFDNQTSGLISNAEGLRDYTSGNIAALGNNPIISKGTLTQEARDPELTSTAEVVGVGVVEAGLSFAREIEVFEQKIAIGVTPKLQKIYTFHYGNEIRNFDDVDSDVIDDSRLDYTDVNIDIGASYRFGKNNNWMAGVVVKNAISNSYRYKDTTIHNPNTGETKTLEGGKVTLDPQFRGGIAYQSKFFNAAFDLDLIKNKPVAYEAATQYASLGVEFDAWSWLQLRAGYRTNLKSTDMKTISAGIGISPFDVFVMDITALANASDYKKEAGAVFEMGLNF